MNRLGRLSPLLVLTACASPAPVEPSLSEGHDATDASAHRTVVLPGRADGAVELRAPSMGLAFTLVGAGPAPHARRAQRSEYGGALGPGTTLRLRALPNGVEDQLVFDDRPREPVVRYRVDVREAAGLRLVHDVLELVDAGGAPRLRVARPFLLDGKGLRRAAHLALPDCGHDDDPRAPWGRAPTHAQRTHCTLEVRWDDAGVTYPATLDPVWTTTGAMVDGRVEPKLDVIKSGPQQGRVFVAGGLSHDNLGGGDPTGLVHAAAELFDPATGTWAATSPMPAPRRAHTLAYVELPAGPAILVAGGCDTYDVAVCAPTDTTWLYDVASATWSDGPEPLPEPRRMQWSATLADGRVFINAGAGLPLALTARLFDPATQTWGSVAPLSKPRREVAALGLPDGRLFVAGGLSIMGATQFELDDAELWDPVTDAWAPAGVQSLPAWGQLPVLLADGRVALSGGESGASALTWTETWDPATSTFSAAGETAFPRIGHGVVRLSNGHVFAAGGFDGTGVELFDPLSGTWHLSGPALDDYRWKLGAVPLLDGRALFVGGLKDLEWPVATADSFVVGPLPVAATCLTDGDCDGVHCVDQVCCDAACDGACEACSALSKGGGADGACGPVGAGLPDPKQQCDPSPSDPCGAQGLCDGQGACVLTAEGEACAGCPPNHLGSCDGAGLCVCLGPTCFDERHLQTTQGTILDCAPYLCEADDCGKACNTGADCAPGFVCDDLHRCIDFGDGPGVQGVVLPEDPGSGCAVSRRARGASWLPLALAAAILGLRRRRPGALLAPP